MVEILSACVLHQECRVEREVLDHSLGLLVEE